jgi:hypothetical protein
MGLVETGEDGLQDLLQVVCLQRSGRVSFLIGARVSICVLPAIAQLLGSRELFLDFSLAQDLVQGVFWFVERRENVCVEPVGALSDTHAYSAVVWLPASVGRVVEAVAETGNLDPKDAHQMDQGSLDMHVVSEYKASVRSLTPAVGLFAESGDLLIKVDLKMYFIRRNVLSLSTHAIGGDAIPFGEKG